MDPGILGKTEMVCSRADAFDHLVGAIVARCELLVGLECKRHSLMMLEAKLYALVDCKPTEIYDRVHVVVGLS